MIVVSWFTKGIITEWKRMDNLAGLPENESEVFKDRLFVNSQCYLLHFDSLSYPHMLVLYLQFTAIANNSPHDSDRETAVFPQI